MIPLNEIISDRLINALGWTIIHSIWQISIITLGYFLLTSLFYKDRSQSRYNLGIVSLIVLLGATGITFWRIYSSYIPDSIVSRIAQLNKGADVAAASSSSLISVIQDFLSQQMPLIVGLWFLGVLILVIQFVRDYFHNIMISKHPGQDTADRWEKRLYDLCRRMKLEKLIRMKESSHIHTPMTIGHLKPIIFFPLGLLSSIPADQVEAILAHELAHILRRDYLINILQNFVDIFFFYHPGIRWISTRIRAERENCCDDVAVGVVGDSIKFANALASIQAWSINQPALAMSACGRKDKLFHRIRRVTKMKQKDTRSLEGLIGACVLGLFLVIAGIAASASSMEPDSTAPSQMKTKLFSMEAAGVVDVRVESQVKGTIQCFITDNHKGMKYYDLKEELDGNPFLYTSTITLKPGDYRVTWTDNCKVKVIKKLEAAAALEADIIKHKAFLKELEAEIKELKAKGENLSAQEKEKLTKLYQESNQLEYEIKLKEAKVSGVKLPEQAQKEIQKREMEIKELYLKTEEIKAKGDSMTQKDEEILKKCEILIKEHRKAIQKIIETEKIE
jgi:beta-lactamase regulating signal transducer with metallopeptidase domain